uniref:Ig-like domain-containing protein n=1 Tax=Anabas testudineus TaxID=64144 RepID=A0AAQ6IIR7_ANATE
DFLLISVFVHIFKQKHLTQIFFYVTTDVDSVIVLTQTPAVHTASTEQEVVLKCNIERYDRNSVSWYKQVPGKAPQYVLRFHYTDSSPSFGSGFSSNRFNSKASSNIDYQFIIKRAETGDSAQYFCQTWDDSASAAVSL